MTVWFATGNGHKKKELSAILGRAGLSGELKIPRDSGLAFDPEETGNTFLENALLKARALYRLLMERRPPLFRLGDPVIADDSGLCVDALGGRPGVFSARYGGEGGKKLTPEERNALLLSEMADKARRDARFVCAMVLLYGEDRFFTAQETLEGELVKNMAAGRGQGGFGYDPILYLPKLGRTVAELSEEEKNRLSHRGKAGKIIAAILGSLL
jgi:XTP/dITP diphosphohydrolase